MSFNTIQYKITIYLADSSCRYLNWLLVALQMIATNLLAHVQERLAKPALDVWVVNNVFSN